MRPEAPDGVPRGRPGRGARARARWTLAALMVVTLATGLVACGGGPERRQGSNDLPSPEEQGRQAGDPEVQSSEPPPGEGSLLRSPGGAAGVMSLFERRLGLVQVRDVTVYDDRITLEGRDPAKPANVDEYSYFAGELAQGRPVHTSATENLDESMFRLTDVAWDRLPELAGTALQQLAIEDAAVTHAIAGIELAFVEGSTESFDRVVLRVYVSGPRRSGILKATADGTVLEVAQS